MIYLLLSVICSTSIFIVFKFIDKSKINTFSAIIINYLVATSLGFIISNESYKINEFIFNPNLLGLILLIGVIFISMFFFIAKSSQINGIAITSIASKMSVVIPIFFSIFYYNEYLYFFKIFALILALASIVLIIYKKKNASNINIYLPIILFFGIGILDSIMKYAQVEFLSENNLANFTALCFGSAAVMGIVFNIIKPASFINYFNLKVFIFGLLLGCFNYGSMFFLIKALNTNLFESSIIFGLNNLGIVTFSVLIAIILFNEKISLINWIGVILSISTILLLTFI